MLRSRKRLILLLSGLVSLLIVTAFLYMLGMTSLEGEPRGFWRGFEWAGESLSRPVMLWRGFLLAPSADDRVRGAGAFHRGIFGFFGNTDLLDPIFGRAIRKHVCPRTLQR
jgi:hypothetical protein